MWKNCYYLLDYHDCVNLRDFMIQFEFHLTFIHWLNIIVSIWITGLQLIDVRLIYVSITCKYNVPSYKNFKQFWSERQIILWISNIFDKWKKYQELFKQIVNNSIYTINRIHVQSSLPRLHRLSFDEGWIRNDWCGT